MRSKIIKDTKYRGYSLFESEKTKDGFYKTTIDQLIDMAERMAAKHSKVLALRIDVHSPQGSDTHLTSRDMTRIIENTKRNINNRLKHGKNAPDIQSIWTQEQTCMSEHPHYHLQISCNGNAIKNGYGIFHELNNQVSRHLKTDDGKNNQGLVHYCESNKGAGLLIDRNSPDFESQRAETVRMGSYIAKCSGKESLPKGSRVSSSSLKGLGSRNLQQNNVGVASPPQETETAEHLIDDRYSNEHHRQHDTSNVPSSAPVSKITDDESAIEEMLKRDWELYRASERDA